MMAELMIALRDLKKSYGSAEGEVHALRGITLDINKGESVAVMGHSGSGKSTLLSMIGALTPPTAGTIEIDGINIYALSQEKRADFRREYLGFVFQQFQLIPYLTAMENVLLPLVTTSLPNRQKREMAKQVLCRVGLAGKTDRLPNALSGGEQERIAIARAIVNAPPVILADEPTGNLDSRTGEEIMALFSSLNKDGLTLLMVTHNPDNTRYMGRTIVLKDGLLCNDQAEILALAAGRGGRRGA
jgi:putative ABC transport system ATP-binding protein